MAIDTAMFWDVRFFWVLLIIVLGNSAVAHSSASTPRNRGSVRYSRASNSWEQAAQITDFRIAPTDQFGVYKYAFKTSNGIDVQAAGSPLEAIGIYSYVSPEGQPIEVRYIADELGFHVVGRHLPRPPPIPDYILRSLDYIGTHDEYGRPKSPQH